MNLEGGAKPGPKGPGGPPGFGPKGAKGRGPGLKGVGEFKRGAEKPQGGAPGARGTTPRGGGKGFQFPPGGNPGWGAAGRTVC